jgi:glycosyltransferase involved in cell wall biosynthesis
MSKRMLDLLRLGFLRSKATVLPYGIDTKRFTPVPSAAARQRFGLDPEAFVVLWPHSDSPTKWRDIAEEATERLQDTLRRSVVLWKPRQIPHVDMPLCYHAANCLLIVSDTEGSPTVVKEALSAAVPVVGVDVGDVWSWIDRVEWCRRARRDPADIAQRLAEVCWAPRPKEPPSFIREFDSDRVARELLAIYQDVIPDGQAS